VSNKRSASELVERRAYSEAGHAAAAAHFRIPILRVGLPMPLTQTPISAYAGLNEACQLNPGEPPDLQRIDAYVMFLLAGSAAAMIHAGSLKEANSPSFSRRHFRARWYTDAWENPEPKVDAAYAIIVAWLPIHWPFQIDKVRNKLWKRSCNLLETPAVWDGVERIAQRLRAGEILGERDILELVGGNLT
jgi:hypothetical protein